MPSPRPIYVEILIEGTLGELWHRTQTPELHQRWDLRFSEITYLPRPDPGTPQQFLYATRLGFGLTIAGGGETVGERESETGDRASALKFWSDDWKSLIREGSGFWKYQPGANGVRFFTRYDYRVRGGAAGRIFDAVIFRPLMGWATAWSFDRLRLWIERGIPPEVSRERALVHALARASVGFVWIYHGLIPKLVFRDHDELVMLAAGGLAASRQIPALIVFGVLEILFGLVVLWRWRERWPLVLSILAMLLATAGVMLSAPHYLTSAFNALTLDFSVAALALIAFLVGPHLPSATRCRRMPAKLPNES